MQPIVSQRRTPGEPKPIAHLRKGTINLMLTNISLFAELRMAWMGETECNQNEQKVVVDTRSVTCPACRQILGDAQDAIGKARQGMKFDTVLGWVSTPAAKPITA